MSQTVEATLDVGRRTSPGDLERGTRTRRRFRPDPVVTAATLLAAVLHVGWALFLATGGGDLAAQTAWSYFAWRHPGSAYNLAWYGGMHPASYSGLSPYLMALLGVRTVAVGAGTLSAGLTALLLVRSRIRRPLLPALWASFAFACTIASGRVTFTLGMSFALLALVLVYTPRGPRGLRAVALVALGVLSTLSSPVAGLFLEVAAAALFLTGRRRPAYALAIGPPVVQGTSSLLFPFSGVQPFPLLPAIAAAGGAVVLAVCAPASWRAVRAGAVVYAVGVLLTWIIPSPVGSNVERFAQLFGAMVLLAAAGAGVAPRKAVVLYTAFAVIGTWQVINPIVDLVNTAPAAGWNHHAAGLLSELKRVGADRGRVEVVPERTHREASGLATHVNLARGWNRQVDVDRHGLFYDGTLNPRTYHAWVRREAVGYVALSAAEPDPSSKGEADLVRSGNLPWLRPIWRDRHWSLYQVADPVPLADRPASVVHAGDDDLTLTVPRRGSVLIRIRWSPWLAVHGTARACLAGAGEWTRLHANAPGRYHIEARYRLPRGTPC